MNRRNSRGAGVLALVTQTHLPAVRLICLPQSAVGTSTARRLAGELKPAKMPLLAKPCPHLPQHAAAELGVGSTEGD